MFLVICSWLKKKNGLTDLNYAQLEAAYQGIVTWNRVSEWVSELVSLWVSEWVNEWLVLYPEI